MCVLHWSYRNGRVDAVLAQPLKSFESISQAIASYLAHPPAIDFGVKDVRFAAFAMACPIDGDNVRMTNANWSFSIEALRQEFGFDKLLVVNDFTALAMSIPRFSADQVRQVGGGVVKPNTGHWLAGCRNRPGRFRLDPIR